MNITDDNGATYKLLANALKEKGYSYTISHKAGRPKVTYISQSGRCWSTPIPRIHYPFISGAVKDLSNDKNAAYEFAQATGIPVPATMYIRAGQQLDLSAIQKLVNAHAPLIVKPNDSAFSKGLSTNIHSVDEVVDAIEVARAVRQSDVLVQEQVSGEEVRFTIVHGKVVAALLRQTPRIIGDGRRSVRELIADENKARLALEFPYIHYPQLDTSIIDATFFTRTDVAKEGEIIELSRAAMIRDGCSIFNVLDNIHPSYIKEVERLTDSIDANFFIVDFLIEDYMQPAVSNNYWFLEFNVSPALRLYYACRDGRMVDIAPIVADLIDEHLSSAK